LTMALEHEKYVTSLINDIYSEAQADKDYRTSQFLDWFIAEQAEEEATAQELIGRFELFGEDSKGLYLLDKELGAREHEEPSLEL
ncbi:MAG: ferritin, partial [Clostridiales bacterium]|nr:ferritin [Clostridiales bacterium]